MITLISFLLVFGFLVFVHEFGHYIVAKRAGIKIEEFAFGFFVPIYTWKKNGVKYSINLIPIGGYVKMLGEEGGHEDNPQSFSYQSFSKKAQILSAGVIMNIFLCILILSFGYGIGMKSLIPGMWDHPGVVNTQKVKILEVNKNSPADKAGLKPNDKILEVNEEKIFLDFEFATFVADKENQTVNLLIERDGKKENIKLIPTLNEDEKRAVIGVIIETEGKIRSPWYLAPIAGFLETLRLAKLTVIGIFNFFATLFTRFSIGEEVVGPAGIFAVTGMFAKLGFFYLLQFVAILSLSLGLVNILPIPALDGGHILIFGIERLAGKKLSLEIRAFINTLGFAFLILLVILVTVKDFGRFEIFRNLFGR